MAPRAGAASSRAPTRRPSSSSGAPRRPPAARFTSRSVGSSNVRGGMTPLARLRARKEWQLVEVLPLADRALAWGWWTVLLLRGVLPVGFAVAMGLLTGAVAQGGSLLAPLLVAGLVFVLLQTLAPIHT